MGIVYISLFSLITLFLFVQGLKLHKGREVSIVLILTLGCIQGVQFQSGLAHDAFYFSVADHVVLSTLFSLVAFMDVIRKKRLRPAG